MLHYRTFVASVLLVVGIIGYGTEAHSQVTNLTAQQADDASNRQLHADQFVDSIDPFSGALKLVYRDVVVPGNGGLDIEVSRVYDTSAIALDLAVRTSHITTVTPPGSIIMPSSYESSSQWVGLGLGWTIAIAPKVILSGESMTPTAVEEFLCTRQGSVVKYRLVLPDGGGEPFHRTSPSDGFSHVVTKSNWKLTCDGPGGRYRLYSPQGVMYELGASDYLHPEHANAKAYQATRVVDRNGNWLSINYASFGAAAGTLQYPRRAQLPTLITASDGRSVALIYDAGVPATTSYRDGRPPQLIRIEAPGAVWRYVHRDGAPPYSLLAEVVRPDGSSWKYTYWDNVQKPSQFPYSWPLTNAEGSSYRLKSVVYPAGGTMSYEYETSEPYSRWLDGVACTEFSVPPEDDFRTQHVQVRRKSTSDGGDWQYSYAPGRSAGQHDVTTVNGPRGQETYKHIGFGYFTPASLANLDPMQFRCSGAETAIAGAWQYGLLVEHTTGSVYREQYSWVSRQVGFYVYLIEGRLIALRDVGVHAPMLSSKAITVDGAQYTTTYSNYDAYGNPGTVTEVGPNGGNRVTTQSYYVNTSKWILHQLQNESFTGSATTRTFDGNGNLTSVTKDGVAKIFTHDGQGNVATARFPRDLVHTYSNYKHGIPQSESQPEGVNISRTVSDAGYVIAETNGEGHTRSFSYDGLGRITYIAYPQGNRTSVSYTPVSKSAKRGALTENTEYDGFGRPVRNTLGGIATTFSYDSLGRKTFESNPGATTGTSYEYDALNRIKKVTNADTTYKSYSYGAGSMTITDERAKVTTQHFRAYGGPANSFLMSIVAADPSANMTIGRNSVDLLTSVNQGGVTRTFGYDSRNYLTSESNAETGTTTYERDAAGNMAARIVGSLRTDFVYDGQNRLMGVSYSDGTPAVTQTYSKTNKLKTVSSSVATRTLGYDANDNLTSESLAVGVVQLAAQYSYTNSDQLSAITYPVSGRVVSFSPDELGRPTQVSGYVNAVTYWPSGLPRQVTYANGLVTGYEQNSRLWPGAFYTRNSNNAYYVSSAYAYDGVGNLTSISDAVDGNMSRTLGYDNINRLTSAAGPWGAGTISYDGAGNLRGQSLGAFNLTYSYDAQNRLSQVTGSRSASYAYDAQGNISAAGNAAYSYDAVPNLRCANCNSATRVDYSYDGLSKRVAVAKSGSTIYEFHNANGDLLVEYTPTQANKLVEYIYLGGKRVAQRVSDQSPPTAIAATRSTVVVNNARGATITVQVGGSSPAGTVAFYEGATFLGMAPVLDGLASIDLLGLALGAHTITAVYSGDGSHSGNTLVFQLRVVDLAWLPVVLDLVLN